MDRFTHDNTEGYDDADLAILNRAWSSLPIVVADDDDIAVQSVKDHIAALLLEGYDRGLRGEELTTFYYVPEDGI